MDIITHRVMRITSRETPTAHRPASIAEMGTLRGQQEITFQLTRMQVPGLAAKPLPAEPSQQSTFFFSFSSFSHASSWEAAAHVEGKSSLLR